MHRTAAAERSGADAGEAVAAALESACGVRLGQLRLSSAGRKGAEDTSAYVWPRPRVVVGGAGLVSAAAFAHPPPSSVQDPVVGF